MFSRLNGLNIDAVPKVRFFLSIIALNDMPVVSIAPTKLRITKLLSI